MRNCNMNVKVFFTDLQKSFEKDKYKSTNGGWIVVQ